MDKENGLPRRKHPRLGNYDYSSAGAYFITICTQGRRCVLSRVVRREIAPEETFEAEHTLFGDIAEKQLFSLEARYPHLTIDRYVIMPDHIHVIMVLSGEAVEIGNRAAGENRRCAITDIVCAYKSLTVRECKKNGFVGKLFQDSFYEHIIRGQAEHEELGKYIYENPMRWYYDRSGAGK